MNRKFLVIAGLAVLTGCDMNYWWTRGQTPGPEQVYTRAEASLNDTLSSGSTHRPDIEPVVKSMKESLAAVVSDFDESKASDAPASTDLRDRIEEAKRDFYDFEGKLSIGSRAPYGELAGQLRLFAQAAKTTEGFDRQAFRLFAARVYFFMANELTVPPPNFGS